MNRSENSVQRIQRKLGSDMNFRRLLAGNSLYSRFGEPDPGLPCGVRQLAMSAYALVQTKNGHKLRNSGDSDGPGVRPTEGRKLGLTGHSATLDQLAFFLSSPLGIPVLDKTGLKGQYDFEFDLTSYRTGGPGSADPPQDPVAVLQAALPRQLGLRLEARKMPVDMLVVDRIEKTPLEN
jgi:uncharacterized protein (TIGR03435 family)